LLPKSPAELELELELLCTGGGRRGDDNGAACEAWPLLTDDAEPFIAVFAFIRRRCSRFFLEGVDVCPCSKAGAWQGVLVSNSDRQQRTVCTDYFLFQSLKQLSWLLEKMRSSQI